MKDEAEKKAKEEAEKAAKAAEEEAKVSIQPEDPNISADFNSIISLLS